MNRKIYILFVCRDNSLLSQMAEAMVKLYRDDEIVAYSAGIYPVERIQPRAVAMMEKLGYNEMKLHTPKSIANAPDFHYDFVITIGVPAYVGDKSADRRLEWRFSEMDENDEVLMMRLRDKLLNKVLNLVISVAV
ncbi:MAG: hypothetical protein KIS94_04480 [Chitinophagales bacterium]|nr:hypothetical protein [Chitinophagales bacterium]